MISPTSLDLFALFDARTGPVTSLVDIEVPGVRWASQGEVCETAGFGLASGAPATAGCSFATQSDARVPAMGEAIERYCGHLINHRQLVWSTWREFCTAGVEAVDPNALALFRNSQLDRPGFPFSGLGPDDLASWVLGADFDGAPVWVPSALVWLAAGPQSLGADGRHITLPINAGIAAGARRSDAVAHGLREVVERHALAQAWHDGRTFPRLLGLPIAEHFTAYCVPNRWNLPIVLAAYRDSQLLSFGCAHSYSWPIAATKACTEAALMARTTSLIDSGELDWHRPAGPLAPWRGDRAYLRCYADDYGNVTDVTCHAQLLLDPDMQALVGTRLGSPTDGILVAELPDICAGVVRTSPTERNESTNRQDVSHHAVLSGVLRADGLAPVVVDLTTPDVAQCGVHVVRVVVPGLRSTAPGAFPFLGDGFEPLPKMPCLLPVPHV